jgi:hypothetical protein
VQKRAFVFKALASLTLCQLVLKAQTFRVFPNLKIIFGTLLFPAFSPEIAAG